MSQVLQCPNCGATSEIGDGIESGQFVCAKCKSTVGFGPGSTMVLDRTTIQDELSGKKLAGYEVKELLGAGGMGKVYLARQVSINRPVALKILAARLAENENFTKRFVREAQAAGQLLHPNLVTVFDAGKEGNIYYFSMEYVKGESVSKLIFERGKLPAGEAVGIVRQVAQALRYAFEHGIIHRDIKPDNIMMTPSGQVKLADMGLAKYIEGPEGQSGLTLEGAVMGTPHYLAPEQARNSRDVDQRADIYSLGCTLYNMLTGKVPFSGSSTYEILRKHETEDPVFPEDCEVPEPVQALVKRMMAKDAADRPQTPQDVLNAIDEIVGAASTGAIPTPPVTVGSMPTEAVPGPPGRTPTPVDPSAPASSIAPGPTEPVAAPARKSSLGLVIALAAVVIAVLIGLGLFASVRKKQVPARRFATAERYAKEHPEDTEGILRRYNEVAGEFAGTQWANRAKQAILEMGYTQLEDALKEGSGDLDRLLDQMKKIQESTPDEEFARSVGERMERLREARRQGAELEFRRFKDEIEKLIKQGKFGEAKTRLGAFPADKVVAIKKQVDRYTKRVAAMAQVEQVAKGFYDALFAKDWDKALKYSEPASEKDRQKRKTAVAFYGNALVKATQPRNYRVVGVQVDLDKGRALISGKMTISRKKLGGRVEVIDVPVENSAVLRSGKWYMQMDDKSKRPARDKSQPEHPRRRERRPGRNGRN